MWLRDCPGNVLLPLTAKLLETHWIHQNKEDGQTQPVHHPGLHCPSSQAPCYRQCPWPRVAENSFTWDSRQLGAGGMGRLGGGLLADSFLST